jgi:hypothetical protein
MKNDFSQCLNSLTKSMLKNCQISKRLNASRVSTIKFRSWLLATTHRENDGVLLLSLGTHINEVMRKRKPHQVA